jgi:NTE family protein
VATSPTIDLKQRARMMANELQAMDLRVAIVGEEAVGMPAAYFDELETRNEIVMLLSTLGDTPWFKMTQRHSDRIWMFARSDARPSVPLLPDDPSPARQFKLVDLILLHHASERSAARTLEWKYASEAARVFHWNGMDEDECRRLARTMAGKSVGLVLSGGGARAYAQIGVIRALREANCPIDFVGGTSMGAVIAATVACGWDDAEIDRRIRKAFVESNPLSDYRLPVVGLVKGHKVDARLKEHFGEVQIEDLPVPYFSVSTNLTQGTFQVHTEGLLRDALRATISLPGILPPVVSHKQVLVDGALERAAKWPGTPDLKNPYFNLSLAAEHKKDFDLGVQRLALKDDNIYPDDLAMVHWEHWPLADLAYHDQSLRASDATVADLY